jgi:tRNA A37 N6-isopentenylltransferase MiaA
MQMIAQIRTSPAALFAALLAALGRRRRGSGFLTRLLTEGAAQEPAAENSVEKKTESHEEDNEEDKTKRTQTPAAHKLKRHSCAGATQRTSRVSTIQRRFPRPRKSPRPW